MQKIAHSGSLEICFRVVDARIARFHDTLGVGLNKRIYLRDGLSF
jgi:hypothetical protein